ncbi:MAG: tRNA lysidine(34) synthetase TilS [Clostridiales bacterium]|nr:tRNA lysidine(34) synthetase TilS [Clostridiales bacterium]
MSKEDVFSGLYAAVKRSYEKSERPGKVLAAVSGGADSVALLALLCALRDAEHIELGAVHIHHGLREASDREETDVRKLCERLNVPLRVCHVRVGNGNTESMARQARYDAFFRICMEDGYPVIALGHHAADRAETFLMRAVRGCGEGLGALREWSTRENGIMLWRPLLDALPEQLREADREKGLEWCEDESNADTKYVRNYLRNDVFPLLEEKVTGSVKGMARSAMIIGDEQEFMREEAEKFLLLNASDSPVPSFDAGRFSSVHPALQRHIIRLFFEKRCGEIPFETEEAVRGMKPGEKINLPGDTYAVRYGDRIYHTGSKRPGKVNGYLIETPYTGDPGDGVFSQGCPAGCAANAVLRFRENGDYIYPLGTNGRKSLGDYMTDRKIPAPVRDFIPVLCDGKEVLWVIGWGVSKKMRIRDDAECVMLLYCPDGE